MVDELIVNCLNRDAGCEFTCQRQLLAAHIKDDCLFAEERCPDPECSKKALRKEILGDNPRCPHRLVLCEICATEMRASELIVSIPALLVPDIPGFISPYRRTTGSAPRRQHIALLAISNISIQKLHLMLKCVLP
jgi:hypothetical protein